MSRSCSGGGPQGAGPRGTGPPSGRMRPRTIDSSRSAGGAHMEWTVHGRRSIYESPWVSLDLVDVELPDGRRFEQHVVRMARPVAAVVVVDEHDRVLLLWR